MDSIQNSLGTTFREHQTNDLALKTGGFSVCELPVVGEGIG